MLEQGRQAAAMVQLARAAANRHPGCANLHCTELEAVKTKPCSPCLFSRYCCRAC